MTDRTKANLFRHIRPIHLLTVFALYLAGTGLARYLGARLDFTAFGLGITWLFCLLLGLFLLGDQFRISFLPAVLPANPASQVEEDQKKSSFPNLLLYSSLALLSAAGMLTILMGVGGMISPTVGMVMTGYFVFGTALIIPGLTLRYSGIGEFLISICLVIFPPALAFLTQYGEMHRFLSLIIFPLFPLHLSFVLTLSLRSFPADHRSELRTLMVRLGWVRGVFLHNLLLLSAFILFGAALLFGLPLRIVGPVFFTLIPAGYLIWIYSGLERGGPVRWPLIIFLSLVIFFLPVYLITFTSWIF